MVSDYSLGMELSPFDFGSPIYQLRGPIRFNGGPWNNRIVPIVGWPTYLCVAIWPERPVLAEYDEVREPYVVKSCTYHLQKMYLTNESDGSTAFYYEYDFEGLHTLIGEFDASFELMHEETTRKCAGISSKRDAESRSGCRAFNCLGHRESRERMSAAQALGRCGEVATAGLGSRRRRQETSQFSSAICISRARVITASRKMVGT